MNELPLKPGDEFTRDFALTADVHQGFIALFGDRNPLHVDPAFARSKGFASEVMHGNILNGFLSFFVGECLPFKNVIIHSQEIQYRKPVYLGDALKLRAEVLDVHPAVGAVELRFAFADRFGETVAKGKLQIGLLL